MIFVFGLGNPGKEYERTRHNVGFIVLETLASKLGLEFTHSEKLEAFIAKKADVVLVKPTTFMNESGRSVEKVMKFYDKENFKKNLMAKSFENVILIHDDLDIPWGNTKLVFGSGPKAHNGVNSVREVLQSDRFWYARIGVDNRQEEQCVPHEFVLRHLSQPEYTQLQTSCIPLVERIYAKIIS